MSVSDMTEERRTVIMKCRSDGYFDGSTAASFGNRLAPSADQYMRSAYELGWHAGRYERRDIPLPAGINPTDPQAYAQSLYCEEVGESLTLIGSAGRFGYDGPSREGLPGGNRMALAKEMGDVLAAIEYGCLAGYVDRELIEMQKDRKLSKLLSPHSRDLQGRRLAPPPLGYDEPV